MRAAVQAGVSPAKISIDPGIGKWIPEKTAITIWPFWTTLGGCAFWRDRWWRPYPASPSSEQRLRLPDPEQRLPGTLAATAIAVYLGAHIVRTHDISASKDTIAMARPFEAVRPESMMRMDLDVEVLGYLGQGEDLTEI